MKLVLLTEDERLAETLRQAVGGQGHAVVTASGVQVLEGESLPEGDAVVVDERCWQRYASLYRYFGLLKYFVGRPFCLIACRRGMRLKAATHKPDAVIFRGFGSTEALEAVSALQRAAAAR
jgi:hypothetical protein